MKEVVNALLPNLVHVTRIMSHKHLLHTGNDLWHDLVPLKLGEPLLNHRVKGWQC